jgi:hypothetical protein
MEFRKKKTLLPLLPYWKVAPIKINENNSPFSFFSFFFFSAAKLGYYFCLIVPQGMKDSIYLPFCLLRKNKKRKRKKMNMNILKSLSRLAWFGVTST